jgi:hypothetical protein
MSWLAEDVVETDAQALIDRLEEQIGQKASTYVSTGDSSAVLRVLQGRADDATGIMGSVDCNRDPGTASGGEERWRNRHEERDAVVNTE